MDVGTGYGQPPGTFHEELTLVSPGTPCGEFMRRYWQPVAMATDATSTPRLIKALGEELVLFRDGSGRPGLLLPRCVHRGASLYFGATEERGLRCCYHGWLFDAEGYCLEQPCEPFGGLYRDRVRQPWYPVVEYHGLLFAYMGPPERKPVFPTYDVIEEPLAEGEMIVADDTSLGSGGPVICDFNWLQHWENVMDPFHVPILHARFSGMQFVEDMAIIPEVTFSYTPRGVRSVQLRTLKDGSTLRRITEVMFPNLRIVPSPKLALGRTPWISWVLPLDDTSFRIYTIGRVTEPDAIANARSTYGGKPWHELTDEEHRAMPGDYESQRSQGVFQLHSLESLSTTDQGVTMLRRSLRREIERVAAGEDPAGVTQDPAEAQIAIEGGNFILSVTNRS
jgi:nitrite reductase/ring-hydroxylating ferredoxin subunit